ncbi:MAG: glycoside hydrolase [Vicinamibacteria bacterium]|nr:glycoside hydrolase [Vicinamibacteria bacterium]
MTRCPLFDMNQQGSARFSLCPNRSVFNQRSDEPLTYVEKGAFETGIYRNLFIELGHSADEVTARVRDAYDRLFHGDPSEEAVMFPAGANANGPLAYIKDIGHDNICSEGMSYGMMIAVQLDRRDDFNALWNWAKTRMYHADAAHPCHGYFSWQALPDGTMIDEMPAPDGEEYMATALFFAAHRWGDGEGIFDYSSEARRLVSFMKNRAPIDGHVGGNRKTVVALFHPGAKSVRFTPDTNNFPINGDHTDPSYHLPAFYELWALWGLEQDREFWSDAATASRDFFVKAAHPKTALTPDYAEFDGRPKSASWDEGTANFRYDAWRTAINWSMDSAWWAKDARQHDLSDRLLAFFESKGTLYGSAFTLDGNTLNPDHSPGLVAANAVASLAATRARARRFVKELWAARVPSGGTRYFDGMLYLMSLLHVSGNFRIHAPSRRPYL